MGTFDELFDYLRKGRNRCIREGYAAAHCMTRQAQDQPPSSPWCKSIVAPRAAMRPAGKA